MQRDDELYLDVVASVLKYCTGKIATLQVAYPNLRFLDWDAHAETHELPTNDLLGPSAVTLSEDQTDFLEMTAAIGVSTIDDIGLFRIRGLVSTIFGDMRPTKQIPLYRYATGQQVAWIVMAAPTMVSPMSRAETRLFQFIQFRGLLSPLAETLG
jgi:hypothetical protein